MTPKQAQNIAELWANFHSEDIRLSEIKQALVCLANYYEDNRFLTDNRQEFKEKRKGKAGVDKKEIKMNTLKDILAEAIYESKYSALTDGYKKEVDRYCLMIIGLYKENVDKAINLLQGSTWQSMNDKMIAQRVIEILDVEDEKG